MQGKGDSQNASSFHTLRQGLSGLSSAETTPPPTDGLAQQV